MVINLTAKESKFQLLIILSVILAFSPLKVLMLVYPFLFIFLLIFFIPSATIVNLVRLFYFVLAYLCVCVCYSIINKDFLWSNAVMFFITISPITIFFLKFRFDVSQELLSKLGKALLVVLLIQGIIAIIQVVIGFLFITFTFDSANGDFATGTISLIPGSGAKSGSNQVFAILQSSFLAIAFAFLSNTKTRFKKIFFAVVLVSWIGASVMHSIIFWIMALIFSVVYISLGKRTNQDGKKIKLKRYLLVAFMTVGVVIYLLPGNVSLLRTYATQTFFADDGNISPKAVATINTAVGLSQSKPYQPIVGLGPGQYSSRASLILSGEYLSGSSLPFKSVSADLGEYILPIWVDYKYNRFQAGSTHFPFYSWLSLYGEFGLLGILVLLVIAFLNLNKLKKRITQDNYQLCLTGSLIILYMLALGLQDNYWEWNQATLPIFLYQKLIYTHLSQTATIEQEG